MRLRRGVLAVGVLALVLGLLSGRAPGLRNERIAAPHAVAAFADVAASVTTHQLGSVPSWRWGPVGPQRSDAGPSSPEPAAALTAALAAALLLVRRIALAERARPPLSWRGGMTPSRAPPTSRLD